MIVENITYIEFLQLSSEDRLYYEELYRVAALPEINCMDWKWGQVKEAQDMLSSNVTYEDILNVSKLHDISLNEHSLLSVVLTTFKAIEKSIQAITEIENNAMQYQQPAKEKVAAEAVGGFAQFLTLPQTLALVGVIAPSVKEVNEYEWPYCFNVSVYLHRQMLFQKELYKT